MNISALTVDRQDSYLAVGSASGVVNLYQTNARCVKEDGSMLSLSKVSMFVGIGGLGSYFYSKVTEASCGRPKGPTFTSCGPLRKKILFLGEK